MGFFRRFFGTLSGVPRRTKLLLALLAALGGLALNIQQKASHYAQAPPPAIMQPVPVAQQKMVKAKKKDLSLQQLAQQRVAQRRKTELVHIARESTLLQKSLEEEKQLIQKDNFSQAERVQKGLYMLGNRILERIQNLYDDGLLNDAEKEDLRKDADSLVAQIPALEEELKRAQREIVAVRD